jgi:hypothetical protein
MINASSFPAANLSVCVLLEIAFQLDAVTQSFIVLLNENGAVDLDLFFHFSFSSFLHCAYKILWCCLMRHKIVTMAEIKKE